MEEKYFEKCKRILEQEFETKFQGSLTSEDLKFQSLLTNALKGIGDIQPPQTVIEYYQFLYHVRQICRDWTNREILNNPIIRKIFKLSDWIIFAQKTKLFWETHEVAEFPRITIFRNAPKNSLFLEYLKNQDNLDDDEKEILYTHRIIYHHEISVKELIRLGFLGTEFLKVQNSYLNSKRLVIDARQDNRDLEIFFRNFYGEKLKPSVYPADENLALDAIPFFSKFDLKIEKPIFWNKMLDLIDNADLKTKLDSLVE